MYFLTEMENDLGHVFHHLKMQAHVNVKNVLKRSNNLLKGDYFLCLKSIDYRRNMREELVSKLIDIPHISKCMIDEEENLILFINRPLVFRNCLKNVMKYENNYGMKNLKQSYFVLVHNKEVVDFDSLRVTFVADHFISFLSANNAEVHVNSYESYSALSCKNIHSHVCYGDCTEKIELLSLRIKHEAECSKFKKHEGDDNYITIDGQESVNQFLCPNRFDNNVSDIKLIKNEHDPVTALGAYIAHFDNLFAPELHRDYQNGQVFLHICLQNQKHKITKSALLLETLDIVKSVQYFLSCQNTQVVIESQITVDSFIDFQKKEIKNAISHKYAENTVENEMLMKDMEVLVDTALKFHFLKAGANVPLKIKFPFLHSSQNEGIFVQYNYARLLNLFQNFELKVHQGVYRSLPSLEETDFQLLKLQEEWNLLNFILSFPRIVEETFILFKKPVFHANKICIMLIKLCRIFSLYYSKIRILGGQQLHLQKVMHARLWLLKGVYQIIHNSFIMLNIQGLKHM